MPLNLSGVFGDIGNLAGSVSGQDVLQSILAGAAGTVVISGLQSSGGQDAIDPLHIFHKPATPTTPAVTGVVQGKVMTMTQYLALSADNQKMIQAMGYTILPG